MDLIEMATRMLQQKLGTQASTGDISGALQDLLGGEGNGIDLSAIVGKLMSQGNLGDIVQSWLGDGDNKGIDASQIFEIFGRGKVSEFASRVGVGETEAADALSNVLPEMVDKSSSGGSLLDQAGGLGGLMGMAKKLF